MIVVSDRAIVELKKVIEEQKQQDPSSGEIYVRVAVKGGGCSGYQHTLCLDEGCGDKDTVYEIDGLKVVIDNRSALYLEGATLHFVDELNRRGFKFTNPNAKTTCGCGSSFSL